MNLQITSYDALGQMFINLAYSARDPQTGLWRLMSVGSGTIPWAEPDVVLSGASGAIERVALWSLDQIYGPGLSAPLFTSAD